MARHLTLGRCAHGVPTLRAALGFAALVGLLLAAPPRRAAAQRYIKTNPQLKPADAQLQLGKAMAALRDPQVGDQGLDDIKGYFIGYFFPMMTDYSPAQLGLLVENRDKLFRQYINMPRVSPAAQKYLVELTASTMPKIAKGKYHPAVRYNAALTLGQLDQQAATTGAGARPPVPLPAATGELAGLLEAEAMPSPVKVAALVGLERHTRFGADPQFADRITKAALAVITREEPPADVSAPAFNWMRCLAARVLVNQFAKGGLTPEANDALVKLVGTKQMALDDRCKVAETLVPAMYESAQGVDGAGMVEALGQLARDVLSAERKEAEKYREEALRAGGGFTPPGGGFDGGGRGGGGYGRPGGYGGEFGGRGGDGGMAFDPNLSLESQGPRYERRRMLDRVAAIVTGGNAVLAGGSDELKQRMNQLLTPLTQAVESAAKKDAGDAQVARIVVDLAEEVEGIVAGWSGGDEQPAEEQPADEPPADDAAAADDEPTS